MTGGDGAGPSATPQLTLTSEKIDAERVTCEKYGGKHHEVEADYVVEVYDKEIGAEVEVRCCESCKDEFSEWLKPAKIRKLRLAERWEK